MIVATGICACGGMAGAAKFGELVFGFGDEFELVGIVDGAATFFIGASVGLSLAERLPAG